MFHRISVDVLTSNQELRQAVKPSPVIVSCSWRTLTIKINPIYEVITEANIKLIGILDGINLRCNKLTKYIHSGTIALTRFLSVHAVYIVKITFKAVVKIHKTTTLIICYPRIPSLGKLLCKNFHDFTCSAFLFRDAKTIFDIVSLTSH